MMKNTTLRNNIVLILWSASLMITLCITVSTNNNSIRNNNVTNARNFGFVKSSLTLPEILRENKINGSNRSCKKASNRSNGSNVSCTKSLNTSKISTPSTRSSYYLYEDSENTKNTNNVSNNRETRLNSITNQGEEYVRGKHVSEHTVARTLSQALHMATTEEMDRDSNVFVVGEDVGHYGGSYKVTKDLHYKYGNFRVFDTPICENTFTGMAIGAAMNGLRPIVEGMNMGFLLLAFNQISNNAGMVQYTSGGNFQVPIVIRGPGGIGKQLGPEHSQRIEAYLNAVPGLKLVACSTPKNARGLLKSAIRDNNPVVFFEHVLLYNLKDQIPLLPYTQPLDKAEIARPGDDITILCYSRMRHVATEAAERLSTMGINAEVLDLISLKPLDLNSIKKSLDKTHKCLILDESSKTGGIGGEIYAQVAENFAHILDDLPVRLCSKDIPTPYSKSMEQITVVTPEDVVNSVLWINSARRGQNISTPRLESLLKTR